MVQRVVMKWDVRSCLDFGGELYSKRLAKYTGIYNAELSALFKAVRLARDDNQSTPTVIFTDSQSVKNSIENTNTDHPLISKILHFILEAHKDGKRITVCWVPVHIGISQNEQVEEGASAAAASDVLIRNPPVHYRDYYPIIRRMIYARWEQIWSDVMVKLWSSSSQRNQRLEVILCRLRIGHTRMTRKWIVEGNEVLTNCDSRTKRERNRNLPTLTVGGAHYCLEIVRWAQELFGGSYRKVTSARGPVRHSPELKRQKELLLLTVIINFSNF